MGETEKDGRRETGDRKKRNRSPGPPSPVFRHSLRERAAMRILGYGLLAMYLLLLACVEAEVLGADLRRGWQTMTRREHVEDIADKRHGYRIEMGGTMDGENTRSPVGYQVYDQAFEPNFFVRMENMGDAPVVNPWLMANGRDWRTLASIVAGVVTPEMTEAEKAMALWTFQRGCRFHASPYDNDNRTAVKMFNVYGYTLCGDDSYCLADLCRQAGLRVRAGHPIGHTTTEVFFNGMWHLLDGDEHVICQMRDNRTIAGEEEIVRDHDLMKRTHVYGILKADDRKTDESSASLFPYEGVREEKKGVYPGHAMEMALRPGEALTWRWDGKGKFHGREKMGSWRNAWSRICNGTLTYAPELTSDLWRYGVVETDNVPEDGALRAGGPGGAHAVFEVKSPYVIVGGRIQARFRRAHLDDRIALAVSFDRKTWQEIWSAGPLGEVSADVSLDRHFPPEGEARYGYDARVSIQGEGAEILALTLESDLQMAPLSLPGVGLGGNEMIYVDESKGQRHIRITHAWQECSASAPPPAPSPPVFPEDGTSVEGTKFTFAWKPVTDQNGEEIIDYHFQLSARADMNDVLSPNFEKLVSRTAQQGQTRYQIPYEGLLNPGETYFWRVRARNASGVWGAWSPVWRFVPQGPGTPLDLRLDVDRGNRSAVLAWRPNPEGRPPVRYEVYGSDEKGFTASREPYPVVIGKGGKEEVFPANLIGETEGTTYQVVGADLGMANTNCAFYRVVAVDAKGVRSGPSDYADMPRPMIWSRPEAEARTGERYTYRVKVVRSIGDLRTIVIDGNPYNSAFRDGDALSFVLGEAPGWLSIGETSGALSGYPTAPGRYRIKIRVVREQGGEDAQTYVLTVNEPSQ